MKRSLDQALTDFMREDDYIGLWQVIGRISSYLNIDRKKTTLDEAGKFWSTLADFVTRMLNSGFIAVDLSKNGGYVAWPEQEPKQVMSKIRNLVVEANGKLDDMMYGVWFNNMNKTPKPKFSAYPLADT